ncbi:succinylglutamate desuccinylase/aspartoacylase family protein [Nereida sp. MMG025]|uniref:succinylglutamate desuccinylase/aspartoacylase family protein n=1 Tax=Nereida sp. MMG025 TaxID=2909981 RepID=UPI001F25A41D|nr:succinylglutamate desuccinylase/aspartoacylase family protein [Nereida sp. MMG025]MCF6444087.1 succinylglutamate desuccinylase/aspartoacylase family protein [Nereida sp. MMG025]
MPMRPPFELAGVSVTAGSQATVELPVSVLADHTPVGLRVQVLHGKRSGPTAFVSAAVHGDEVVGVEIVRRLLNVLDIKSVRGTLLVVPVVNAFGFLNRSRYLPDRRDLNRSFPGSSRGSLASRLAQIFLDDVVSPCSFGIDLHSAAVHRTNLPQCRVSPSNPNTLSMARVFGAPVILRSALREGSLRAEAEARGVDVLLYEAGEGLRFDEMAVRAGVTGILRVLHQAGMLPSKGIPKVKNPPMVCASSQWLRAPAGGLLRTFKGDGDVVGAGDVMASVADPFGAIEAEIVAPSDGIVIGRAVMPLVNEGDAVFHLADLPKRGDAESTVEDIAAELEASPLFDEDEII